MVRAGAGLRLRRRQHAEASTARTLAGTVEPPILGKEAKLATLAASVPPSAALRIGDAMTRGRRRQRPADAEGGGPGRGLPRQARRSRREVPARIDHGDLTALLYLQGYRQQRIRRKERPMTEATQIVLAKRPAGDVTADCFREESVDPAGAGRRPGAGALALPVARSLHAAAHDRAALLHAALRARQAADRRLGRRGGGVAATRASPRATR